MIVTLSTGEKVQFKTVFTHAMHKALYEAVNKGVVWKQDAETGDFVKEVPATQMEFQYESVMSLVIEKIEKDGKEVAYSDAWLNELPQKDFAKLEEAVTELRKGDPEKGKKNS